MNTESYKFISQKISTETGEEPRADIVFSIRGEEIHASASGSGPVDAIFKAIESVAQSGATLQIYSVNAVTQGTESQGELLSVCNVAIVWSTVKAQIPTCWWQLPKPTSLP